MTNSIAKKIFASAVAVSSAFMGFAPIAAQAVSAGEVYKTTDGTVWFITSDMQRRPFTSGGAFLSYGFLSWAQVQNATAEVEALTAGSFIAPQDGKIFCATATKGTDVNGECSLVTGGMKAAFTSSAVFTGLGYSFSRAQYGDSSFLTKTANLDNAGAAHSAGVLVNIDGTVYLVGSTSLMGIPSVSVFESWGYSFLDVVTANSADRSMTKSGIMASRTPGHLSPSTTSDDDDNTSDCNVDGDAGDITLELLSTYAAEEVGEGAEEVSVLGVDVEADDGSDVALTSVKVELEQTTAADSDTLSDYVDEVVIMLDGEVVGSAEADEFTESSDRYSKSIAMDECAIIDAGETAELVVAITANNVLDSGDIDTDAWDVEIDSIRYEDGEGVTTTETPAADAIDQTFDFASFATANDVELKVALADSDEADDINEAHVIDIDDTDETDDVEILAFTIEADGDSGLNIQEIPAIITTSVADESTIISNAQLWYDGESIASDTIAAGGSVVFEDLDVDIEAGEEALFTISVDIEDTGDADLANADTVQASLTGTATTGSVDLIEAEDDSGEEIADGDASGSAVGDAHAVYDAGISVEFVSATAERSFTADAATEDDQGTYTIVFDVTAFDDDMYLDASSEVADANTAGQGVEFSVTSTTGTPVLGSDILESDTSETLDQAAGEFWIEEGDTRRFTLTVIYAADSTPTDGSHFVGLTSINWSDATSAEAAGGVIDADFVNYYEFNLGDYKTPYLFLNGIL